MDDLVQVTEKVKVTPTCMYYSGDREVPPVTVGRQPEAELSSLSPRVCLSKRCSTMADSGAPNVHKLFVWSPNSLMDFTCSSR